MRKYWQQIVNKHNSAATDYRTQAKLVCGNNCLTTNYLQKLNPAMIISSSRSTRHIKLYLLSTAANTQENIFGCCARLVQWGGGQTFSVDDDDDDDEAFKAYRYWKWCLIIATISKFMMFGSMPRASIKNFSGG